ncbi:site-specific integrase [Mucilaginibacter rubeus]|uniref:Site-specific integrase n=1 Tax=Mucilaginibacter rubeus TaxID=2027860 RepID=A0AAE6MK84_9SPHI|nr:MULTISPECIES: site-specific integrase [Mucilaginibacter]QEM05962.1 site-specific integrase [Mucilaginibacter rubeus]QEM18542.1 site-specific integrase [Mucilaginibacter gossypii]QTE44915.1 site-specific integrase [Mucilaginibacter rubeus]QTE51513.1 site-specific integrase [Mucilaginibacter rubeus]QTE56599.1 site-specific integrase [Mucilaginibacter rubeus]
MNKSFNLLFYVKRSKTNVEGLAPVYLRITVDGVRIEVSSKRYVNPDKWNTNGQKLTGNSEEVKSINAYLKTLEHQVYDVHRDMIERKLLITATNLKDKLLGGKPSPGKMLVPIFQEHNRQVATLIGKEYAKGTLDRYETSLKHTQAFLLWKYNSTDIDIRAIDHEFIMAYDFYLRSERSCNNNSTVKYLKNFKKIILICIANGWLDKDPFVKYKPKVKEVKRDFLNAEELEVMANKKLVSDRVSQVRDIFLFSCYTGLAYADVKKLKRTEIVTGIDGQKWVYTSRQKTDTSSRIPLLQEAMELMVKYEEHPQCVNDGLLLPVLSNQKMNSYLKEIADACGINKELTYHIARHTFATTVTLANGVSIESVSKMLGHTNIKTTQHYAKILDMKVAQDMSKLRKLY